MTAKAIKEFLMDEELATASPVAETQFEKDCQMKFQIIKLSESFASYRNEVPDEEWVGEIKGLVNGWMLEYANKDGKVEYDSVSFISGTIESAVALYEAQGGGSWLFDIPRYKGFEPTGRVVFRGYATEYYDPEERDWCVKPYRLGKELSYIQK